MGFFMPFLAGATVVHLRTLRPEFIRDAFPPPKTTTRSGVMERYRTVLLHDRVGRLVGFQEFEHLTGQRRDL